MPESKVVPFNRKKWLLLIEDDDLVRDGIALALRNNGFTVHTTATAEEALQAINRKPYDGIICDYHLPGMSGLDFFRQAGSRLLNSTNILMTAFGFDQIFSCTAVLGIDAFCEKPFSIQSLISALNSGKTWPPQRLSMHGIADRSRLDAAEAALNDR
jgi:DNA-binding response OmpR family regulator